MTNIYQFDFDAWRQQGDPMADAAFLWLKENPDQNPQLHSLSTNQQISNVFPHTPLGDLVQEIQAYEAPDFTKTSILFQTYTTELLGVLGLYSLPYCYAGAKGVRVLYHSKKIRENPKVRLLETAAFVFDLMSPDAVQPNGKGLVSVLKVRLMHAAIRFYSRTKITDEVAINQEDLVATLLSFSLIPIRGLRKLGIAISNDLANAYLQSWAYWGLLLGVNPFLIPRSLTEASQLEALIRKRQFAPSEEGKALTKSLVSYLEGEQIPGLDLQVKELMYALMGEEASRCIGLVPNSPAKAQALLQLAAARNYFTSFSDRHFPNRVTELASRLEAENVKPDFRIPF